MYSVFRCNEVEAILEVSRYGSLSHNMCLNDRTCRCAWHDIETMRVHRSGQTACVASWTRRLDVHRSARKLLQHWKAARTVKEVKLSQFSKQYLNGSNMALVKLLINAVQTLFPLLSILQFIRLYTQQLLYEISRKTYFESEQRNYNQC